MHKKNIFIVFTLLVSFFVIAFYFYPKKEKNFSHNNVVEEDNFVNVAILRPADMKDFFEKKKIDGFLMAHPVAANVVLGNNDADYFIHSSEIWPNHPGSTLATVKNDENILTALVWSHIKATRFINDPENEEKAIAYAMDFSGQNKDVVQESLKYTKHTELPSREATEELLEIMLEDKIIISSLEENGYQEIEDFLDYFLDDSLYDYVNNMLEENPEWKPSVVENVVRVGYIESVLTYMTAYVALKEGYYGEVFDNIELVPFVNAPTLMDAYSAGLIDAGYNGIGGSITKNLNEDLDVKVIAGGNAEGQSLVVRKDIKTKEDLVGKTIATSGAGTTPDFLFRMFLDSEEMIYRLK
jgi:NitT/TauT family transport system substrate-binding protein